MTGNETQTRGPRSLRQTLGLWLGPLIALAIQFLPLPEILSEAGEPVDASSARAVLVVLSMLVLMAVWWVSEAIPIPVTSLLPIVILPLFAVQPLAKVTSAYMHPIVVLLLGGFIIAKAIERWNLHERIALNIVVRAGNHPAKIVGGFMLASAILSMWISNTATSIMMMPIALSVAAAVLGSKGLDQPFTHALLLGIAWACSIGGLGTLVGTPTNLIIVGYLNSEAGFSISFLQWMMLGIPTVLVMLPAAWFVLTRWAFRLEAHASAEQGQRVVRERLAGLGAMATPEKRTLALFGLIASLWVTRRWLNEFAIGDITPLAGLTDHMIAILGVILAFLIPAGAKDQPGGALLDWKDAESIPWGVLLLFGGGMALAGAISASGLGTWIGGEMAPLAALPLIVVIALLTTFVIFATEVTSNIATASALMPVLGAIALASEMPVELLAVPLAMAASCAFMLPMATGPNAVAFATGHVSLPTMAGAGFRFNLLGIVAITALSYLLATRVLG